MSTPGDEYVDPLIKRGEELEHLIAHGLGDPALSVAQDELASIKEYARAKQKHLADFPFAADAREEEAQYLAQQNERSAREREAWLLNAWKVLLHTLGPLVLQFGEAAIGVALMKVPHSVLIPGLTSLDFTPVLSAVEVAARDAAGKALADAVP